MTTITTNGVRAVCLGVALALSAQFIQPGRTFAAAALQLSPSQGPVGTPVTVTGSGFVCANGKINLSYGTTTTQNISLTSGGFTQQIIIPNTATGQFGITAACSSSAVGNSSPVTSNFTVLSPTTLTIAKSVSPTTTVGQGGTLSYTVTVTNTGALTATGVTIVDTLGSGQTLNTATIGLTGTGITGSATCSVSGSTLTCTSAMGSSLNLAAGGHITLTFTTTAGTSGTITNSAYASALNAAQTATAITSVTVSVVVPPPVTGLALTKTVSCTGQLATSTPTNAVLSLPVNTGTSTCTFTVTVSGTLASGCVKVTDPFQTQVFTLGIVCAPGTSPLPAGATTTLPASFQFVRTIGPFGSCGTIALRNTADIVTSTGATVAAATAMVSGQSTGCGTVTVPVGSFPSTFTLCGTVTSITSTQVIISGVTVPFATGVVFQGSTIVAQQSFCLAFTMNTIGLATGVVVTPNLALTNVVCGVFVSGTSVLTVGNMSIPVVTGATFPVVLVPGQTYCFLLNTSGVAVSVLTFIPTSLHVVASTPSKSALRMSFQLARLLKALDTV